MPKVESQFTMIQRRGHRNLNQRFEIVKTLGQGTYGKVKLAIEKKTGRQFAIKSIRKKKITMKQDLGRIRREIEIMSTLGHPHIISVYEVFENPEKIILVMEYASGGELYDYINRKNGLSTSEARRFFRQIVSAVHYLHMHNIVHRDLKLENIVLDSDGNVKIADFGLSNIYADDHMLNTFCGSPLYASPEIVNGQPYCGPEVDCWSLGVLLYTFVYGAMPFDGSDFQRLRRQITDGNYMEPQKPSDATGLIRHLLTPDPKKRATIEAICRHWWINLGYDCTPIEQYPPIKLIDVTRLGENISLAHSQRNSSSDSDDEVNDKPPIQTALPVKGILKKTKSVSTDDEGEATVSKSITSLGGSNDVFDDSSVGIQKTSSPIDAVIPDLNRKPRRGILKNRQPSYSDSGCGLDDTELLLVTPSGGFECPSKDSGNSYDLSDIEAVLGEYDDVKDSTESAHSDCAHTESVHINGVRADTSCLSSTERTVNGFDKRTSAGESRSYDRLNDGSDLPYFNSALSISSFAHSGIVSSTPMQPVKGILKRRRKVSTERDPTWRYSLGSQGSNSSGDILDFSYDSTDADTYLSDILTTVAETKAQMFDNGCLEMATDDDDYGPPPPLPRTAPPQHRHSGIYVDDDDADNIPVTQNGTDLEDIMSRLHVGPTSKMQPCTVESVDFFDLAEARQVCQQALTIGSNWG